MIERHNETVPFEEFADLLESRFPGFACAMGKRATVHFGNGQVRVSWATKPEDETEKKTEPPSPVSTYETSAETDDEAEGDGDE